MSFGGNVRLKPIVGKEAYMAKEIRRWKIKKINTEKRKMRARTNNCTIYYYRYIVREIVVNNPRRSKSTVCYQVLSFYPFDLNFKYVAKGAGRRWYFDSSANVPVYPIENMMLKIVIYKKIIRC